MELIVPPQLVASLLEMQGVQAAPGATAATAETASRLALQSRSEFAALAFEAEPSGHAAAQRRFAP